MKQQIQTILNDSSDQSNGRWALMFIQILPAIRGKLFQHGFMFSSPYDLLLTVYQEVMKKN